MTRIFPVRGYRFSSLAGEPDKLVTQPYDKIGPELQEDYYRRSVYNIARIIKSKEKNSDPDTTYPEAGRLLVEWLRSGILQRDPLPGIYVSTQEFELEGAAWLRRSFISLLELDERGAGVRAHEKTLDEPKMDRLRLLRAIEANDEPIFMLYDDPRREIDGLLDPGAADPFIEVRDDFDAVHRLWHVSDVEVIAAVQKRMADRTLYIADGHHRFETAINFMRECRRQGWKPGAVESFDKRMIACVALQDAGLKILPTHRLVHGMADFRPERFLASATQSFEVRPIEDRSELFQALGSASQTIGFYAGGRRYYLLRLKNAGAVKASLPDASESYRKLDVAILHALLLDRILGIDEARLAAQSNVDYARDREAALERVDAGNYQMAFLLNPTGVGQVCEVAREGEKMPQKSTDFYPKMLTGLVLSKMEIVKGAV